MNKLIIHFEDHGQDFLYWTIDLATREVIGCGPFQGWVWIGVLVYEPEKLKVGDYVVYLRRVVGCSRQINYPITKIERIENGAESSTLINEALEKSQNNILKTQNEHGKEV